MVVHFKIKRTGKTAEERFYQIIPYEYEDPKETVAAALMRMGEDPSLCDSDGNPVSPVRWECSCLQKKCGACAMRINGRPSLACDVLMGDLPGEEILLEPLGKFPVVADLIVDRSILRENLKTIGAWFEEDAVVHESRDGMAFAASRCLQCGCCLEVCPNFYTGGRFAGMAGFVPTARLLSEMTEAQKKRLRKSYRKHIYEGCGKSLACRDICPAGIDLEDLLIRSNAIAVWKRKGF